MLIKKVRHSLTATISPKWSPWQSVVVVCKVLALNSTRLIDEIFTLFPEGDKTSSESRGMNVAENHIVWNHWLRVTVKHRLIHFDIVNLFCLFISGKNLKQM